jgi:hypothetical protein
MLSDHISQDPREASNGATAIVGQSRSRAQLDPARKRPIPCKLARSVISANANTYLDCLYQRSTSLRVHNDHSLSTRTTPATPVQGMGHSCGCKSLAPASCQYRKAPTNHQQTPVGARPWILNNHPDVFPEPKVFRPERWLEAEARGEHLTRYLTTFTKGSRSCLGIK